MSPTVALDRGRQNTFKVVMCKSRKGKQKPFALRGRTGRGRGDRPGSFSQGVGLSVLARSGSWTHIPRRGRLAECPMCFPQADLPDGAHRPHVLFWGFPCPSLLVAASDLKAQHTGTPGRAGEGVQLGVITWASALLHSHCHPRRSSVTLHVTALAPPFDFPMLCIVSRAGFCAS